MRLNVEPFQENKSKLTGFMKHLDASLLSMGVGNSPFLVFIGDENFWLNLQLLSRLDRIATVSYTHLTLPTKRIV